MGINAGSVAVLSGDMKQPLRRCSEPGCEVPEKFIKFGGPDGRWWCISHAPDQRPKLRASLRGAESTRRRKIKCMPSDTPTPDWSTPKAIRGWLEDRAGRIERGELDQRVVPAKLAEIAKATHDSEALEKLDGLEALIKGRLLGGAQ